MELNHALEAADGVWGCVITDVNTTDQQYGATIAHELGHVMNLLHRGMDNLPKEERNRMSNYSGEPVSEDFDLIQLRAVRGSKGSPILTD